MPKISVCIPVYNCDEFIAQAVDSVLKQSMKDWELVVIDNCSTDRTLEIVQQYKDIRIRVLKNEENLGFEYNWNRALDESKGEYIKILPADDMIEPNCLEMQYALLNSNPSLALVCCQRKIIDYRNKTIGTRGMVKKSFESDSCIMIKKIVRSGTNLIGEPGAVIFRNEVLKKIGGFNTENFYVVDLDFWVRVLTTGKLYYQADVLSSFRVSGVSTSTMIKSSQAEDYIRWLKNLVKSGVCKLHWLDFIRGSIMAVTNQLARVVF
jgi:glycosyltransferase involved in cell wall biosynthesis